MLLDQFITETEATQVVVVALTTRSRHWHQTVRTSQIQIILQPTSNLHAILWNIPEQKMAGCYVTPWVWAEHTRTATTWPGSWGKVLAFQGQDFSLKAKAKTWGTKTLSTKAKTFMRCPRGQGQASRTTRLRNWCWLWHMYACYVAQGIIKILFKRD